MKFLGKKVILPMKVTGGLRNNWLDIFFCALLAIIMPLASQYVFTKAINLSFLLILEILFTFLGLLIFVKLFRWLMNYLAHHNKWKKPKKCRKIKAGIDRLFNSKHLLFWLTLIIMICWLPALFMLYPGTLINDSWGQINRVLALQDGEWGFSSHHPMFDTFFISIIIIPIQMITGSWHFGFFAYVIIQALCTSLVFAYSVKYMREKFSQGNLASFIFLLIYCLFPVFVACIQTVSKDALSAWIYLLFVINFVEIIRSRGASLTNKRFLINFIVVCAFCVLTKKVEVYIIFGSLLISWFFIKQNRLKLAIAMAIPLVIAFIVTPVFQKTFNVQPGGLQEMFSLPFQQTANYVKEYPNDISEDEKKVLMKVLDYDNLIADYDPTNADGVKDYYQRGEKKDYIEYLKIWTKQGARHPDAYLEAMGTQLSGWFSYALYKPLTNMNWHNQFNSELFNGDTPYNRNEFFSSTANSFDKIIEFIHSIPIVGVVFSYVFFATILPCFIFCTIFKNRKNNKQKYLLACVPLYLSILMGCYLAPVSVHLEGMRYLYPVVYTLPIMLMLVVATFQKNDTIEKINGKRKQNGQNRGFGALL